MTPEKTPDHPENLPETMHGVVLTGHGGLDKLVYRTDLPVPKPGPDEVLIRVEAAGINNTDINTRIGWYSKSVTTDTDAGGAAGFDAVDDADASWSGTPLHYPRIQGAEACGRIVAVGAGVYRATGIGTPLHFPRIQGADACGRIVAVGAGVDPARIGERVLVQPMTPTPDGAPFSLTTFGSETDGSFAQFAVARARYTYAVNCNWSDAELAAIPCAYSTAENMLHRASVGAETVLITGASGGVGSAAVQLAKRRGATVIAIASQAKHDAVRALGADRVVDRAADLVAELGENSVDVVLDLVGGAGWPVLLDVIRRGGRYITAGAIAGPLVTLDLRTLYLKDLTLFGSTYQVDEVFANLVSYIEAGEIRPTLAATYPLADIARAQEEFLAKSHTGKLVLLPPKPE